MEKQRIIYLLTAYQQETATPEERAEFSKLLHDKRYEASFNELLDQNWDKLPNEEIDQLEIPNYNQILGKIKEQPQPGNRSKTWWFPISIAAAAILVIFSVSLYFINRNVSDSENIQFANDIAPGEKGATLTLANGHKILIKDALAGNIANEAGVKIIKTKDGALIYEIIGKDNGTLQYNTLSTTRAEQTEVRLPDGTSVFLNAESSLKYPTSFAKTKKRQVSLTGEAYFQVTKDKLHPFVVTTQHQSVEVLGTTFNINSYSDESAVKTTLLEGSVRIANLNSNTSSILKPGEQAIIKDMELDIKKVEVDDVIAWKNGYFMFNNETLESILKKVARWYNVEVVYKDDSMKQKTFFGSVSRYENVSELLKLLQKTEGARFEIKGKQIIVDHKK